jgi:hypothetical protein
LLNDVQWVFDFNGGRPIGAGYDGVGLVVVGSRARAKGGEAFWVPCAKPSGGGQLCQTMCGGGSTSIGGDPMEGGLDGVEVVVVVGEACPKRGRRFGAPTQNQAAWLGFG